MMTAIESVGRRSLPFSTVAFGGEATNAVTKYVGHPADLAPVTSTPSLDDDSAAVLIAEGASGTESVRPRHPKLVTPHRNAGMVDRLMRGADR